MKRSINRTLTTLTVIAVLLAIYVIADVAYRLYIYHHLSHTYAEHTSYGCYTTSATLYVFDKDTGYSYNPNTQLVMRSYDDDNTVIRTNRVIVNNAGHLELDNDSLTKPKLEFRIAVVGDSFSATTPSNVTWPTLLQQYLNQDDNLKKTVRAATYKVINFGLDGTGFAQWPSVYKYKVKAFDPDLVIVNFIDNDMYRKYLYRKTVSIAPGDEAVITCSSLPADLSNRDCVNSYLFVHNSAIPVSPGELTRLKREMYGRLVTRLPWLSPYPQLLAALLNGRLGLRPELQVSNQPTPYFENSAEALSASINALNVISAQQPSLIVLYHPTVQECLAKQAPIMVKQLIDREHDVKIDNMLESLPLNASPDEIRRWYNLPYDQHPSDYGAGVYARAVEGRVVQYLTRSSMAVLK